MGLTSLPGVLREVKNWNSMRAHIFIVVCHVEFVAIEHTGAFNWGHFMLFYLIYFS